MIRLFAVFLGLLLCASAPTTVRADVIERLLFETHSYATGEFRGFKIGMSKQAALEHVRAVNPDAHIIPIPFRDFVISGKNLDELKITNDLQGVRLFNYKGFWIDLLFAAGRIATINKSVLAANLSSFEINEPIKTVIDKLKAILTQDPSLRLIPIVPRPKTESYDLKNLSTRGKVDLILHNAWEFEVPSERPVGATYQLYFADGHLERVHYRRARLELP